MAQPMLTPGEIRTGKLAADDQFGVAVYAVAGGAFTQVKVTDEKGRTVQCRVHQFETLALDHFDELTV